MRQSVGRPRHIDVGVRDPYRYANPNHGRRVAQSEHHARQGDAPSGSSERKMASRDQRHIAQGFSLTPSSDRQVAARWPACGRPIHTKQCESRSRDHPEFGVGGDSSTAADQVHFASPWSRRPLDYQDGALEHHYSGKAHRRAEIREIHSPKNSAKAVGHRSLRKSAPYKQEGHH